MKMIVILGSALIASAAAAQQPAGGGASNYDPNEVVCRMIRETGSRLAGKRRCMTRASWDQQGRADRALVSESQIRQVNPQDMNPAERARMNGRYYVGPATPPRN